MSTADAPQREALRFRRVFERVHARHLRCLADEWLAEPCQLADGTVAPRPIVWSRRNGPWRRHAILWVGAAPGNAGGKGAGALGAHGTRIPFGGDIGGANFDVLLSSIGLDRNRTFIAAALNQLPARGGGEPSFAELTAPVGEYPSSLHLLRDTLIAAGPGLVVALGNVALRAVFAAALLDRSPSRLPSLARLDKAGLSRGHALPWPSTEPPGRDFLDRWAEAWPLDPPPALLWLTHPSAQNMSPFAGVGTAFHARMRAAQAALRRAARECLGLEIPAVRPRSPSGGIYALREWRDLVAPRHAQLEHLWREKGV